MKVTKGAYDKGQMLAYIQICVCVRAQSTLLISNEIVFNMEMLPLGICIQ